MTELKLAESLERFDWDVTFTAEEKAGRHWIRGHAIHVGKSSNNVRYSREELLRAARTFVGKSLYVNHIETPKEAEAYLTSKLIEDQELKALLQELKAKGDTRIGVVTDAEFVDDAVAYRAEVTNSKAWGLVKAGKALGVSIGARPRTIEVEDGKRPSGIIFEDLSVIFPPEKPSDAQASVKIVEKLLESLQPRGGEADAKSDMRTDHRLDEALKALEERLKLCEKGLEALTKLEEKCRAYDEMLEMSEAWEKNMAGASTATSGKLVEAKALGMVATQEMAGQPVEPPGFYEGVEEASAPSGFGEAMTRSKYRRHLGQSSRRVP